MTTKCIKNIDEWGEEAAFGIKLSDVLSQEMHESSYICEGKTSTELSNTWAISASVPYPKVAARE